jgi:hypothetical protein
VTNCESDVMLTSVSEGLTLNTQSIQAIDSQAIDRGAKGVVSETRHHAITPERLARMWGIGIEKAKETLSVTTQRGIRKAIHQLHLRYRTDRLNLHVRRMEGQWYMDHLVSKRKSLSGNTGAWVYTNGKYTCVYPVQKRSQVPKTLKKLIDDVGIPERLRVNWLGHILSSKRRFVGFERRCLLLSLEDPIKTITWSWRSGN